MSRQRVAATAQTQYMRGRSSISRPNAFLLSNRVSPIYNLPMFLSFYTLPYLSISMPGHLVYLPISLPLSLSLSVSRPCPCFTHAFGKMFRKTWRAISPYMFQKGDALRGYPRQHTSE